MKKSSSNFYFADSLKQGNKITAEAINKKLCNRKSKSISTRVKPLPVVTLSSSASNDSICSGQSVVFKAAPAGYDFYDRDSILQKKNDSLYSTTNLTQGNVIKVKAENAGCTGKITDSIRIFVKPTPVVTITGDSTICMGSSTLLSASGSTKIDWSNAASGTSISVSPFFTTNYSAKAITNGCASKTDSFTVFVDNDPVEAEAGINKMICINENTILQASGGISYRWSPAHGLTDTLSATPMVSPTITTTYKVHILNLYCIETDSVIITVDRCLETIPPTVIPQVISPNEDGVNDTWIIPNIDYFTKNKVVLFNRWGAQVNSYNYYLNTWEGKNSQGQDLPDGTYYYSIDLGNGSKKITGYIMVHR